MFLQSLHQGCYSRGFLTNGYIDAIDRLTSLKETLLINNSIDCDGGLTRLTVTDNQLTLSTTNGNHRVNSFQASLQRLFHWLSIDHTRCLAVKGHLE